jgi:IclR family acetate operon transcriptional repressor
MRLTEQSGETANLIVLQQNQATYIDQVQSPRLARIFAEIGRSVPLHSTGGGKAILAWLTDEARAEVLGCRKLESLTPRTITSREALDQALGQVRLQGFALDDEEQEEGVRCVAAPVKDHTGRVVAALSLSGPTSRMARERISELGAMVVDACDELSRELGYQAT